MGGDPGRTSSWVGNADAHGQALDRVHGDDDWETQRIRLSRKVRWSASFAPAPVECRLMGPTGSDERGLLCELGRGDTRSSHETSLGDDSNPWSSTHKRYRQNQGRIRRRGARNGITISEQPQVQKLSRHISVQWTQKKERLLPHY